MDIKQKLIEDYLNGMAWDGLCSKYNTTLYSIHKILKDANIPKQRMQKKIWSAEKQKLLTDMYLSNCTYQEMYKALKCKGGTLTYWVKKLGLPMRGSGRNNNFPNKFLENTPESNYWLGYLFADGHISYVPEKRRFSIDLTSEKLYVIEKFIQWYLGYPRLYTSTYTTNNGTVKQLYKASLFDRNLAEWFHNTLGIENVKHHSLNPKIELNWDIICGFFDGDGTASKGHWQLKSCAKDWLQRIQDFLTSEGIKSSLKISYLDCWALTVYKKEDISKIVQKMYKNNYYCHEYKYKLLNPEQETIQ